MKKAIAGMIVVLVAVFATLSVLGSGGEYDAEKLLYRAIKNNNKIAMNPDVAPPLLLSAVERDLEKIVKQYPKSNTAKSAYMVLAEFYAVNKKYDKAFTTVNEISDKYKDDNMLLSLAQYIRGSIYEKQGKWSQALKEYIILRDKYPTSQAGFQISAHIAKHYADKGMDDEAKAAYKDAAIFYARIEKENRDTLLGYTASGLLLASYLNLKDYEQAGKVVEDAINNYFSPVALSQILPYVEPIYVKELKRPEKAVEIYKNVIEKAKDANLKKVLENRIATIELQKPESVKTEKSQ